MITLVLNTVIYLHMIGARVRFVVSSENIDAIKSAIDSGIQFEIEEN